MKKIFCLVYFIQLFLFACTDKTTVNEHNDFKFTNNKITLNQQTDSLLQLFLSGTHHNQSDYYMILYNDCGEHIITFIENNFGNKYYLQKYVLISYAKNGKNVNLITGDFLETETIDQKEIEPKVVNATPFERIISYTIENGAIKVISKGIPPFSPPPSEVISEP